MSKAITGAVELGAAAGIVAGVILTGGAATPLLALETPLWGAIAGSLAVTGVASEAGAIADAIAGNRGASITIRQPAANGGIVYGEYRVGGVLTYASTTGSHKDQYNRVVTVACHPIDSYVNLYLDGRQVFWQSGSAGQQTHNGVTFGGAADGSNHYDAGNNRYNFGSLVYAGPHFGADAVGSYSGDLNANDPVWGPSANGTPYGGDCSWVYIKVEYDSAMFPSVPEFRLTIRGKCDVWDPRTNTYGYTTNWALIMADVLMHPDWGLGIPQAMINTEQLITAANICDELVPLANGTSEPRYTFNGSFDTSASPGDIIEAVKSAAAGSITYSGGQWYIWPAAAYPVSFSWTQDDLIGGIQGSYYRSGRELINAVNGTFTAPNYPYSPAGNLYDSNGHDPDDYSQNNFNYAWQKTSFPPYAQDVLHGYPSNQWLTKDRGVEKWETLSLGGVISVATAQRLAKIKLLRNRLQRGSYTFKFKLGAYQMFVQDVFSLTYPQLGWAGKLLQVTRCELAISYGEDGSPAGLHVEVSASDYDPNCYGWAVTEELTILDAPAYPAQALYDVASPTEVTLNSGAAFDVVGADGVVRPRIQVTWIDPQDAYVTQIETQYSLAYANAWISAGVVPVGIGVSWITTVVAGVYYDVRVRSIRGDGASSDWLLTQNYQCSATSISSITSIGLATGIPWNTTNNATIDSVLGPYSGVDPYVSVRIYGPGGPGTSWTLYTGSGNYTYPATSLDFLPATVGYAMIAPSVQVHEPTAPFLGYRLLTAFNSVQIDGAVVVGMFQSCDATGAGAVVGGGLSSGGGKNGPKAVYLSTS